MDEHKCPCCGGSGFIPAIFKNISLICDICKGKGMVDDEKLSWIEMGKELKDYRINVLKFTMRQASILYGISVILLSQYERGVKKPETPYTKKLL